MNSLKNLVHGHHDKKADEQAGDQPASHHGHHGHSTAAGSGAANEPVEEYKPRHINPADLPPPPTETIKDQSKMTGPGHTGSGTTEKGSRTETNSSDREQGDVTDNTRSSSGRDTQPGSSGLSGNTSSSTGGVGHSGRDTQPGSSGLSGNTSSSTGGVGHSGRETLGRDTTSSGADYASGRGNIGSTGNTGYSGQGTTSAGRDAPALGASGIGSNNQSYDNPTGGNLGGHNLSNTSAQNTSGTSGQYSTFTAPRLDPHQNTNNTSIEDASLHDRVSGGGAERADIAHGRRPETQAQGGAIGRGAVDTGDLASRAPKQDY